MEGPADPEEGLPLQGQLIPRDTNNSACKQEQTTLHLSQQTSHHVPQGSGPPSSCLNHPRAGTRHRGTVVGLRAG